MKRITRQQMEDARPPLVVQPVPMPEVVVAKVKPRVERPLDVEGVHAPRLHSGA